jgi:sugar phosphate isomerase/epimerase
LNENAKHQKPEDGDVVMQINYVVSTMVFWGREHPLSFEQECQLLKSMGLGIELLPNIKGYSECRYRKRNWARLAEATNGMLVSMRSRNDRPNLEQWTEQIECAKLLEAHIVTDLACLRIPEDQDVNGCTFAADVIKLAEQNDVELCLETGPLRILKQMGERFDSIRYCFDTGHANLDPMCGFRRYVDGLIDKTSHLHLTDNYGQGDDHEPPGLQGGIPREDWDYLLEALDNNDSDVIGSFEMCPCVPAVMIRKATEFLFDELRWPNRPRKEPGLAKVKHSRA